MNDPLFESFCNPDTLTLAWQRVRSKHTAAGIDRQTVEEYQHKAGLNILNLSQQLKTGSYIQQPYLEVLIPKNENEKRHLALLTVNDKIVQTAAAFVLTPVFEKSYLNVSYAYRNRKGPVKAIRAVQHLITHQKHTWLASCDIDNFFDSIPHAILFRKLSAFLKSSDMVEIIRQFVTMGKVNKYFGWKNAHSGIPQGGVISPMLANFYLYQLDKLMVDNQYGFVRYADDFIILAKSESEAQDALQKAVSLLTNHLQLSLNKGSEIVPVAKGFEFLGISFSGSTLSLSDRKFKRLSQKMLDASRIGNELITPKLREVLQGIHTFYAKLIPQETLGKLDDELINVIRTKASAEFRTLTQQKKMLAEFDDIEFLAKQHNFKRKEYIEAQLFSIKQVTTKKATTTKATAGTSSEKAVRKRKHEYQKLESAGFNVVIASPGTWLSKRDNRIIVKQQDTIVQEVPLINLRNITIQNEGVSFSSNVIEACSEYHVSINFLKHDGKPYALIHQPNWFNAGTGTAQLEAYNNGKGIYIINQIITGKITNQVNLLKYYGKYYNSRIPAYKDALNETAAVMVSYCREISNLVFENLDDYRLKIFAYEGLAATRYWSTMGILINTKAPFAKRERQGATDLVNCMLNYGYGILYGKITEAIINSNLNPNLSYLHKPENNRPSLVFDMIEEFRQQVVDRAVLALIMKNQNLKCENGLLDIATRKLTALKVIERLNTVETFRNREMRLFEIIDRQAHNLALYLTGEKKNYKPYIRKW